MKKPGSSDEHKYDDFDLPSQATFLRAQKDRKFKDVKSRPKHYHARCQTCAALDSRRAQGFRDGYHEQDFVLQQQLHQAEVRAWRSHEEYVKNSVARAPHAKQLFLYDDTSCLELPHFTNRDIKNLGKSRINIIPFYFGDYGANDSAYIYTPKGRFRKGANRLCTTLYHAIRRTKSRKCPVNSHLARHLVLQADNYSENKNSDVLFFASELVWRGWYDVIDIEFGPVGHTHNGSDAVHKIHNVTCGAFLSFTLGQFIRSFEDGFRKEGSIPAACLLDVQYDWKERYSVPGVGERLSGFTNTSVDEATVSAFRIRLRPMAAAAHVEVVWKRDTTDSQWRGVNSQFETPGFIMLRQLPKGAPPIIPPSETRLQRKYFNELTGLKMRKVVREQAHSTEYAEQVMEWLSEAAKTGRLTKDNEVVECKDSEWGPLVNVGTTDLPQNCHVIRHKANQTGDDFWKLSEEVEQDMQTRARTLQGIRDRHLQLPNVRYTTASAGRNANCSTSSSTRTTAPSSTPNPSVSASTSSNSCSSSTSTSAISTSSSCSSSCTTTISTSAISTSSSSSSSTTAVSASVGTGTSSTGATSTASSTGATSSTSPDDDDDVNDWGARFSDCKDKRMAIQCVEWGCDGMGVSVVQVGTRTHSICQTHHYL